jgi:hypothetical protein
LIIGLGIPRATDSPPNDKAPANRIRLLGACRGRRLIRSSNRYEPRFYRPNPTGPQNLCRGARFLRRGRAPALLASPIQASGLFYTPRIGETPRMNSWGLLDSIIYCTADLRILNLGLPGRTPPSPTPRWEAMHCPAIPGPVHRFYAERPCDRCVASKTKPGSTSLVVRAFYLFLVGSAEPGSLTPSRPPTHADCSCYAFGADLG